MHLEPGQTVLGEQASATECRLIALPIESVTPDPVAALSLARRHGLEVGSTDDYMRELREGESDVEVGADGLGGGHLRSVGHPA